MKRIINASFAFFTILTSCNSGAEKNAREAKPKVASASIIQFERGISCNYSGTVGSDAAYTFQSDNEAITAMNAIMAQTGLPANFSLAASDVDNAAAVIVGRQRYILYNQRFMEQVLQRTKSKYGSLSILAHEIGHHLSGHTLLNSGSRYDLELEADRFSGFVLAKMGATLDEACVAMDNYGSDAASQTHPAKRTRIAAITNGWKNGAPGIASNISSRTPDLYIINVVGVDKYITLRNRRLSADEYKIANSGTPDAELINRQTVMTNLQNGVPVEILASDEVTYQVKAYTTAGIMEGYIVRRFAGVATVSKKAR
ncbi:MAG: hypothetical protein EOO06_03310 [Chitinophagaceae bacterium]|nr:MAG: hypothetical protein EOO06_03310 [Chitinophagaceae bacterium]